MVVNSKAVHSELENAVRSVPRADVIMRGSCAFNDVPWVQFSYIVLVVCVEAAVRERNSYRIR
jgi:hypothetical protein